ncbi:MAG: phosphoenolpyruvate--protein phosphotransferase [Pyrinomonadaceae bacterium]
MTDGIGTSHFENLKTNGEIRITARAVSRGVSSGKVVCLYGSRRQFYRIYLRKIQIDGELKRFRAAVQLAKLQLKKFSKHKSTISDETKINIFDAHYLILEDDSLIFKIENVIAEKKVNAEWAVKIVTDKYIAEYKLIADEYLRERYIDVEDITDRLLNALGGGKSNFLLEENSVIVAKEIKPSTLIELSESTPKAIITEIGGWTSHSFILAREINLPAVTGVEEILKRLHTGDDVIVDGFRGQVILHPTENTIRKYNRQATQFQQVKSPSPSDESKDFTTLDGRRIIIRANVDFIDVNTSKKLSRASGIGLYRSEFLFNQYGGYPTEQEQIKAYRSVADVVRAMRAGIRTFDISPEQLAELTAEKEKNPALGMRGIRLSISNIKDFRTQIRALLQASVKNNIDIVLPMISDVSEIIFTRKILDEEKLDLTKRKINFGEIRLGAMIEVPAAVLIIEEIACEVDFLSLGTNDLVQYLLAVDRDNGTVADWYKTLHPAVIRSIKKVIEAGENRNIPVIVCGEMAGSPVYAAILIGLGAVELSMNLHSIPRVTQTISGIAFEEASQISSQLLDCRSADEGEELIHKFFLQKWSHLFTSEILQSGKKQS